MIKMHIPWKILAKYVFAAALMGTLLYVIPHPTRIYITLAETAIGGLVYLLILMAIDKETRELPRYVLKEFKRK
jgi:hypothetical protein